jgi:leucyl aminopeptidase
MNIHVHVAAEVEYPGERSLLVLPVFEEAPTPRSTLLDEAGQDAVAGLVRAKVFTGAASQAESLVTADRPYAGVVLLGLGKRKAFTAETLRRATGVATKTFARLRADHVVFDASVLPEAPPEAFVEAVILAQYRFEAFKRPNEDAPAPVDVTDITVAAPVDADTTVLAALCARAGVIALNVNWARDLANHPANELTPRRMAALAEDIAARTGAECTVHDEAQLAEMEMRALLGVSRGSAEPPRLIVLRHHHADNVRTLALVGKGVTFDTGGISIKPSQGMQEMKYDMCGAAAALGAMKAVCELKPPVNVVCVVPAVVNMPDGAAQCPGDIVRARNGKTIEVNNTDAEGRLILADALSYCVDEYKPDAVIDLATLTGACLITFGHIAMAMLASDDDLATKLEIASDITGEQLWRLPMGPDYAKLIEGTHGDLANIGPPREASTIVGGQFLKEFVGDARWAHLDIAGVAWGQKHLPYLDPNHATGAGVRLLMEWLRHEEPAPGA